MAAWAERAGEHTRRALPLLLALAAAAAVLRPALRIGFLADDFYMVRSIAEQAEATPGLLERLSAGAVRQWSTRFHAFRPLTTVSLQLDHALHGTDPRGYRLTNLLLWLLAAALFAALCAVYLRLDSAPARAGAFLAFALWPAGVEPIGWTVIRQDALLALGALGAALALGRWRARPWLATVPLALALGAKETALVLPFALVALDAALLVREGKTVRSATLARRAWPWFA